MIKQYIWIKNNRFRRKLQLYKRLAKMSFDITTTFYTVLFFGYVGFAFVRTGGVDTSFISNIIISITMMKITFSSVFTFLPIVFLIRAFRHAGMVITTSEHTLLYLPYTTRQLLQLSFSERMIKTCLIALVSALIVYFIFPIFWSFFAPMIGVYVLVSILMTYVEWKFFQLSFFQKTTVLIITLLAQLLRVFLDIQLFALIVFIVLIILNVVLYRRRTLRIDWQKVTAFSDFHVWNMPIISQATKVKWQKERHYPLWQRMKWWKRPFRYEHRKLYSRLIFIHLEKHIKTVGQFVGTTFILLLATMFIHKLLFYFALIIVALAYKSFVVALLRSLLFTGVLAHLPWKLGTFTRSFYHWMFVLLLPQCILLIVFVWKFFEFITIAIVVVLATAFVVYLKRSLDSFQKQMQGLGKS